jgi:hypothetical protein
MAWRRACRWRGVDGRRNDGRGSFDVELGLGARRRHVASESRCLQGFAAFVK